VKVEALSLREQGKKSKAPAALFYLPEMTPPSRASLAPPGGMGGNQSLKLVGNGDALVAGLMPLIVQNCELFWWGSESLLSVLVSTQA